MHNIIKIFTILVLCSVFYTAKSQCPTPELYDLGLTTSSTTPTWVNCIDNVSTPDDFSLGLVSPDDIVQYTIDWGDGTGLQSGSNWVAGTTISHTYTQLGRFTVTLIETENGCSTTIEGVLINDRKPGATATPPTLNTSGCTPHTLTFINQTTNVSPFTKYAWSWGDQSIDSVLSSSDPGASGNSISHQYLPNTSDCGMEVTLTAISLCQTTFVTFGPYDFWDYDSARVDASQTQICQGETITFQDQTDYNCVTGPRYIQWDLSAVGQGTTGWVAAVPSNQSKSAFINGPVGSTFTINFADSNFCGIDYSSVTVEIIAPPIADVISPKDSVCVGESVIFENRSTGNGSKYDWDFADGTKVVENTKNDATHTYTTSGVYWVKLRAGVAGNPSCSSVDSIKVVVLSAPSLKLTSSVNKGCDTTLVSFSQTHSPDAGVIAWSFGQGKSEVGNGPFNDVPYNEEGIYVAVISTQNSSGCTVVDRDTIRIYPNPNIAFLADSVCSGDTMKFVNNTTVSFQQKDGILRELWKGIGGNNVSNLTNNANFPDSPDQTDIINDFEYKSLNLDKYGTRVHGFVVPPQTGFYTFWIASDDKSELWISESADTANLTKIASVPSNTGFRQWTKFSEQKSATIKLEANKLYYIKALHKEGNGGDHLSVGWQLPSGTLERPIIQQHLKSYADAFHVKSYKWDFGDGNMSSEERPVHLYQTDGTRFVKLTATTGECSNTDSVEVKVVSGTIPDFDVSDTVSCSPLAVELINKSQNATNYKWTLGDGKVINTNQLADTISNTYFNNDTSARAYDIILFANNSLGCASDVKKTIYVNPNPGVVLNVASPTPPCAPTEVEFYNASQKLVGNVYNWLIDKQNTQSNQDTLKYIYSNTTNKIVFDTVGLFVENKFGCKDSITKTVTIFPEPVFNITAPDTVCSGTESLIAVQGFANSTDWSINTNYLRTVPSFRFTFINPTDKDSVFTIKLKAVSVFSCNDSVQTKVVVHPSPKIKLAVNSPNPPCAPVEVGFYNQSQKISGNVYSWVIDKQNTQSSQDTLRHLYNNTTGKAIFDTVSLSVNNPFGCKDSTSSIIRILPEQNFKIKAPDTLCTGTEAIVSIDGFANSTGWDINNSFKRFVPSFNFKFNNTTDKDSVFVIKLRGTSVFSCVDSVQKKVVVKRALKADFSLTPTYQILPSSTVQIQNSSTGDVLKHEWDFDDGKIDSVQNPAAYVYGKAGDFDVKLKISNRYCADSVERQTQIVLPLPVADFSGSDTACVPHSVTFKNLSSHGLTYRWDFGDGGSSTDENPTHTYLQPGQYSVKLVAMNLSGEDSLLKNDIINIIHQPIAFFSTTPNIGSQEIVGPADFYFKNQSQYALKYTWDFDDNGAKSKDLNVNYTYRNAGVYSPTLIAENNIGCTDTFTLFPPIRVVNGGKIHIPNAFNPNAQLQTNQVFKPVVLGDVEKYSLIIYNRWGEALFTSDDIDVGWDGMYLGEEATLGVYVYVIKVTFSTGSQEKYVGDVTLLR